MPTTAADRTWDPLPDDAYRWRQEAQQSVAGAKKSSPCLAEPRTASQPAVAWQGALQREHPRQRPPPRVHRTVYGSAGDVMPGGAARYARLAPVCVIHSSTCMIVQSSEISSDVMFCSSSVAEILFIEVGSVVKCLRSIVNVSEI